MISDFTRTSHTFVVSDIHLADAEPPHSGNALWKRYKRPKLFIDRAFRNFLEFARKSSADGPIELVLNGDIFDFDSVMVLPEHPDFKVSWLEHRRGLSAEEAKSCFKMSVILADHPVWVDAIREFVEAGNRVVFILGNHDMELHWPGVRQEIFETLNLAEEKKASVRFCEWFYVSNRDTLVEHGNQYDAYSLCADPINPLIKKGSGIFVRLPFGNIANKYMLNGMGLFNPHVESTYIKPFFKEYLVFFFKYLIRVQPMIAWTWFWGALVTVFYSLSEGFHPSMKDPLMHEARVNDIAERANANPGIVRGLFELRVHPAYFDPIKILRELWLDRALLLGLIFFGTFQFFTFLNVVASVPVAWFLVMFLLLMPLYVFYARSVESDVYKVQKEARRNVPLSTQIAGVTRAVHGHTHRELHTWVDGVELLNTGTWSPGFQDAECTVAHGKKCFAWIKPNPRGAGRIAELYEWVDPQAVRMEPAEAEH